MNDTKQLGSPTVEPRCEKEPGVVDWLALAERLADRYDAGPKTIKAAFRKRGLPPSTGYALAAIGRRARLCSAQERARLKQAGSAKARLIAQAPADIAVGRLLDLAERLPARALARAIAEERARRASVRIPDDGEGERS